jgi:hypothetical protein
VQKNIVKWVDIQVFYAKPVIGRRAFKYIIIIIIIIIFDLSFKSTQGQHCFFFSLNGSMNRNMYSFSINNMLIHIAFSNFQISLYLPFPLFAFDA